MTATTTAAPGHPAPARGIVPIWRLWFGLFGAAVLWALQLIANYALVSHFCYPSDTPLASPTWGGTRVVTVVVSVVVLLGALAALSTAITSWRSLREGRDREHHELLEVGEGRVRFMAFAGILLSSVFIFAILMNGLPVITMPLCTY